MGEMKKNEFSPLQGGITLCYNTRRCDKVGQMPSNRKDEQMKITKEELAAKLEAHAKWLKTRYTGHVEGERADLTCADLTDANLTDADITDADLTCADLTRADLTRADLTRADLTDANLTDADIEHVGRASTLVWDAISATLSARIALKKTRI